MRALSLPLEHPAPDAREFVDILAGKSASHRVPLIEYIVDDVVMKPIVEYPEDVFDAVMAINVRGSFLACKYGLPRMNDGGSIVMETGSNMTGTAKTR